MRPAASTVERDVAEGGLALEASVGTLVHRCLELIVRAAHAPVRGREADQEGEGLAGWSARRVRALAPVYRRWLRESGHGAREARQGAELVVTALCRTLASPAGRWILAQHDGAGAEQAWSARGVEDGAPVTVNHVIDRIFVADGCRWIVDYKTVRADADDSSTAMQMRAGEYRPQLERYAALFSNDPLPLRMAIFFPLQGALVELSRDQCPPGIDLIRQA
jgi:ATP-dependent exoDNAse (exonuclease V) beta subunit